MVRVIDGREVDLTASRQTTCSVETDIAYILKAYTSTTIYMRVLFGLFFFKIIAFRIFNNWKSLIYKPWFC